MKKHLCYCLTINNPVASDFKAMKAFDGLYSVFGMEGYAPGRTPHLQCCIVYNSPVTWKYVKSLFPRAHIEQLRYDFYLAAEYCKKEGVFEESGDRVQAAKAILTFLARIDKLRSTAALGDKGVSVTPSLAAVSPGVVSVTPEVSFIPTIKTDDISKSDS